MNTLVNISLWIAYVVSLYFSVFLLLVYLDKRELLMEKRLVGQLSKFPMVSILIPAYNEEKTIIKTLQSVTNLNYPQHKLQIIAIDDGSTDATKKKIQKFVKGHSNFELLSHKNCGKAASLNKALRIAKGEFFACLDADSFVEPETLRNMLSVYENENDPKLAIVTPAMKVYKPKTILEKIQWLEYIVIILIARLSSYLDSLYVAPGPFSVYRTKIIKDLGGFDEENITEDQEIAYRLQKHQYKILHCPEGHVYTTAPKEIKPFYKQRRRWYLGSIICLHKYKKMVANKKYGDFGLIQMIKNVAGFVLATTGILVALFLFLNPFLTRIKNMMLVKFNIIPYLTTLKLKLTFFTFLLADFRKGFLIVFLFIIGIFFFYQAHKNANEKISKFGLLPLIPYFAFYYLLKGMILLVSLFEFSRSKKIKW